MLSLYYIFSIIQQACSELNTNTNTNGEKRAASFKECQQTRRLAKSEITILESSFAYTFRLHRDCQNTCLPTPLRQRGERLKFLTLLFVKACISFISYKNFTFVTDPILIRVTERNKWFNVFF